MLFFDPTPKNKKKWQNDSCKCCNDAQKSNLYTEKNHYPPSTSSEALNTELLEALWRAGLKFNYNYTSHRGLYTDQKARKGSDSLRKQRTFRDATPPTVSPQNDVCATNEEIPY